MTIGAVVVGTGFGARVHVPALRAAGFDVRALVGRDANGPRGAPSAWASSTRAPRWPTRWHSTAWSAVTIAAPPDAHAALAIEACDAGRHVICEKPFALDAARPRR